MIAIKIKISLLGFFILLIGGLIAPIHIIQGQQQVQSNTYNDPQGRFSINYPSDWQLTTTNSPLLKQNLPAFISPNGMFFSVLVMPVPSQFNNIDSITALQGFMTGFQKHIHNPTIIQNIECNTYIILGKNACSTIIRGYNKNIPISSLVVGAVINGNAYFFAAEGLSNTFYFNLPTVKQIISSFQPLNQQTAAASLLASNNGNTSNETNSTSNNLINANSSSTTSPITNYTNYTNTNYGVSIQYPSNWLKNDTSHGQTFVEFNSPEVDSKNFYNVDFRLAIDNTTSNPDLNSYLQSAISSYKSSSDFQNFEVIESGTNYNLAGQQAYKLIGIYTDPAGIKNTAIEIGTKVGSSIYYIQTLVDSDQYFNYLPVINNMTNSFTLNVPSNGTMQSNTTVPVQNNSGINNSQGSTNNSSSTSNTSPSTTATIATGSNNTSISELYNKVKDSVVSIDTIGDKINSHLVVNGSPVITGPCGELGSGFIYNQNGVIVTNWHVVSGQDDCQIRDIRVTFNDGNTYSVALKGQDPFSDLAVLQLPLSAAEKEHLNPLPIVNSSGVFVGEEVAAVGNPEGLSGSITRGIISQIDREGFDPLTAIYLRENLIQTDAAINPGNSGGPLLNMQGQVVGINEQGEPVNNAFLNSLGVSAPGIGFDVPYSDINKIVPKLIQYGNYSHPSIGIAIDNALPSELQKLGVSDPNEANGVIVLSVFPNSPASNVGINPSNDTYTNIIYQIDNTTIKNKSDMVNYIETKAPGDNVTLQSFDNNGRHTTNITLKEKGELLKDLLQNNSRLYSANANDNNNIKIHRILLQSSDNQPTVNEDKNQNINYNHELKLSSLSGFPITKRGYSALTENGIPSTDNRLAINDNPINGTSSGLPIDTINSTMTANYNNDTFGINTIYHSDWSVIDNFTSNNSSTSQDISQFISPDGSASITISKDNPGYNISDVKDYLTSTMNNQRSIYGNLSIINSDSCNVEDINSKPCTVELAKVMQTPGYDLSFSYTGDNGTLWTKEITGILVGDSDVYYITLVAPSDQFSSYKGVMDDIINNLTIDVTNTNYMAVQPSIIDEHPNIGGV